jgi:predicted dehydrogenase
VVDSGEIGEIVAAVAFMAGHGHEHWHPSPEFYYKKGGGPVFDMGPYYLTALVSIIGAVDRVSGSAKITFPERTITSEPLNGQVIRVEVPTHVTGILEFASGCTGTMVMSFDVWGANLPRIELYGTKGSLSVPDPNGFKGPVKIRTAAQKEWREIPVTRSYTENSRGIGVADMALAVHEDRDHRASGQMASHVLDIMHRLHESSEQQRFVKLDSSCNRPEPLPVDYRL